MYFLIQIFFLQVGAGRSRRISNDKCKHTGIDLLIADIPENLPVPGISIPSTIIPPWNVRPEKYVDTIFEFAEIYLHDDAALLLFHANDRDVLIDVEECAETYNFHLECDWWGMNDLPLASPRNPSTTVIVIFISSFSFHQFIFLFMYFFIFLFILSILVNIFLWQCTRFWVQLFVRSGNVQSQFSIAENFEHHDYFYNFVSSDSQLMHGSVPWRGPREKNPEFMKSFIEALSKVGDIIFEWNASTGYFLLSFFPTIFSFSNLVFHNHTHIYIYIY